MNPVLDSWRYCTTRESRTRVFPDGCRDVIVVRSPRSRHWFVSALDASARSVKVDAHCAYRGWRLRPGTTVDESELAAIARRRGLDGEAIASCCNLDATAAELLSALCGALSLKAAAKRAGVSARTLQRQVAKATGKPPLFWMRLARCRRAALAVRRNTPLAQAAADHGFSDQAHMSREFRHWLALSPREVQRACPETSALEAGGYE